MRGKCRHTRKRNQEALPEGAPSLAQAMQGAMERRSLVTYRMVLGQVPVVVEAVPPHVRNRVKLGLQAADCIVPGHVEQYKQTYRGGDNSCRDYRKDHRYCGNRPVHDKIAPLSVLNPTTGESDAGGWYTLYHTLHAPVLFFETQAMP